MATLELHIVGEFSTRAFSYYYADYKENGFRPADIEDPAEVKRLVLSTDKSAYCLAVRSYDSNGTHIRLLARQKDLISGDFTIEADGNLPRIKAKVNGTFEVKINDPDDIKYFKKYLKSGIGFAVTDVHFQREEVDIYPFGMEGGVIDGIDWEAYDKMPKAQLMNTDIVDLSRKPSKSKSKPPLKLPLNVDLQLELAEEALTTTDQAVQNGLRLNVGLKIKGGLNSFIVTPDQIVGSCSISIEGTMLSIKLDGYVEFKEDAWVRKYRTQAPFTVTLDSYWDSEGTIGYLGKYNNERGHHESVEVGKLSLE